MRLRLESCRLNETNIPGAGKVLQHMRRSKNGMNAVGHGQCARAAKSSIQLALAPRQGHESNEGVGNRADLRLYGLAINSNVLAHGRLFLHVSARSA